MAKVISGSVGSDGRIYDGGGFRVEVDNYGYRIIFDTLRTIPNVVAQPWNDGGAISCQTVGQLPSPIAVTIQPLDKNGYFSKSSFNFVAVSNE